MAVTLIDTHEVVKTLQAAGFTEMQAEAVSHLVVRSHESGVAALATKQELQATEARLLASITETRHELQASLAETRRDLGAGLADTRRDLEAGLADTRHELQASIAETRQDLRTTEARLQASLAETKAEILKWMVSAIGLQTAAIIGAVIALIRFLR